MALGLEYGSGGQSFSSNDPASAECVCVCSGGRVGYNVGERIHRRQWKRGGLAKTKQGLKAQSRGTEFRSELMEVSGAVR